MVKLKALHKELVTWRQNIRLIILLMNSVLRDSYIRSFALFFVDLMAQASFWISVHELIVWAQRSLIGNEPFENSSILLFSFLDKGLAPSYFIVLLLTTSLILRVIVEKVIARASANYLNTNIWNSIKLSENKILEPTQKWVRNFVSGEYLQLYRIVFSSFRLAFKLVYLLCASVCLLIIEPIFAVILLLSSCSLILMISIKTINRIMDSSTTSLEARKKWAGAVKQILMENDRPNADPSPYKFLSETTRHLSYLMQYGRNTQVTVGTFLLVAAIVMINLWELNLSSQFGPIVLTILLVVFYVANLGSVAVDIITFLRFIPIIRKGVQVFEISRESVSLYDGKGSNKEPEAIE